MSTFPTYGGELPEYLNPFNPRHYWLLAYWVYFRPTALKYYLYRSNPDLYRDGLGLNVFRTLGLPTYRNLYLMMPVAVMLISALVLGLLFALMPSFQETPIDWLGLAIGVAIGALISCAYSGVGNMVLNVAGGVTGGVAFGVAASVAISLLAGGVQFGIEVGAAIALTGGLAFSVAFGVTGGVAFGVLFGVAFALSIGMVVSPVLGVPDGARVAVWGVAGALRGIPLYPLELLLSLGTVSDKKHPVEWDELLVLPLPVTRLVLIWRLQQNTENTDNRLGIIAEVARNPFQRWTAQQALHIYFHRHQAPLYFLYELLRSPKLDEYVFSPIGPGDWEALRTTRQLLLAELNKHWMDCSTNPISRLADILVWVLTRAWRDRNQTGLTYFAGMLYNLLDKRTIDDRDFDLSQYQATYKGLTDYTGGVEISQSFVALATFLAYDHIDRLPAAIDVAETLPEIPLETAIRPQVLTALGNLKEVGAEVATYQAATTRVNKLAAVARASDSLNRLEKYISDEIVAPEKTILRRIIRQWDRLVSDAEGEVANEKIVGRVSSPYVAGKPVTGKLFVGRDDIMQKLKQIWDKSKQWDSVVLFGHRRMGKTSILQNLGAHFSDRTLIIDFNMQRIGRVENTGKLLFYLAEKMYDAWVERTQTDIGELNQEEFINDPYIAFDRFLQRLDRVVDGDRFIVTVDEFEGIERQIDQGRIDTFLLEHWRGTFQTYHWFIMAFAGLHNLEEMRRDYWNPLYSSVRPIRVSFLKDSAAWQLITQPSDDFPLDYDKDAVDRIIQLTNGQPYLVQLICDNLVTLFNRQTVDEGIKRDPRLTVKDVEAVINSPEFYQDSGAYFEGVWNQAKYPAGQWEILKALVDTSLSLTELANRTGLRQDRVLDALKTLQNHDAIEQRGENYFYTVELMRRWVEKQKMPAVWHSESLSSRGELLEQHYI